MGVAVNPTAGSGDSQGDGDVTAALLFAVGMRRRDIRTVNAESKRHKSFGIKSASETAHSIP